MWSIPDIQAIVDTIRHLKGYCGWSVRQIAVELDLSEKEIEDTVSVANRLRPDGRQRSDHGMSSAFLYLHYQRNEARNEAARKVKMTGKGLPEQLIKAHELCAVENVPMAKVMIARAIVATGGKLGFGLEQDYEIRRKLLRRAVEGDWSRTDAEGAVRRAKADLNFALALLLSND